MSKDTDNKNLPASTGGGASSSDDTSTGISLTPSITSLLKPTTDYLGTELRDFVKSKVEDLKARKRKKNVSGHMEKVGVKLGIPLSYDEESIDNIQQLDLFDEWLDGAQDISPDDPTLSQLWQGLLRDIVQGKANNRLLINTLKELEANEAALLLRYKERRLFHPRGNEERFILRKLKRLELIEYDWFYVSTIAVSYIMVIAMLFTFPGFKALGVFGKETNLIFIALISLLPVSAFVAMLPKYKTSWLGRKLLSYVSDEDAKKANSA